LFQTYLPQQLTLPQVLLDVALLKLSMTFACALLLIGSVVVLLTMIYETEVWSLQILLKVTLTLLCTSTWPSQSPSLLTRTL
jgi:hypothetical protein